jgi:putative hydrolase of the HAD superfamily
MTKNMTLRAVLFDYGMVLSAPADCDAWNSLKRICGLEESAFELHYWANRREYDAGKYVGKTYWRKVALDAGITLSSEQIRDLIYYDVKMWSSVDKEMIAWALTLGEAGYRTGILSNICKELVASLEKHFDWVHRFDHRIWSCRVGLAKPDEAIFRHTIAELRLAPEEILYIDDRAENIVSAGTLGMQGIIYRNMSQLRSELEILNLSRLLPALPQ